ncbi:HAD family hydrolase [Roseateles toxinivorans]|uniref:HAD superfamily hydrolase (TIGR01509 family) n=1 Tax=Roseateles toxinivorans TaxID=270368 RepID=A0A4R6QJ46_9BURK|nr:HAD family phosphatase [Roseateles toxinivorans]TDP63726.1 HAD superfamily hydrolase (TIGR01509 family) [Roseateles toxinivorans]
MQKFDAVLFDCDGVLVDSEAISAAVMRDLLSIRGWEMTQEDCLSLLHGKALKDLAPLIAERTGDVVDEAWMVEFRALRDVQLDRHVRAVPHIHEALIALQSGGLRMACASGADRVKIELQLARTGLAPFFAGRIFSGHEVARNKPWPDVYLAAAEGLGVAPERCAVVEDSVTGVRAGVAAGARVFGYAPLAGAEALRAAGAGRVLNSMAELTQALASPLT